MINSFSGAHPYRPQCLIALLEANGYTGSAADVVAGLTERLDAGVCPRCGGPLPAPPVYPSGSRITWCRCVPVCGICGRDEVHGVVAGAREDPGEWPIDRAAMLARNVQDSATHAVMSLDHGRLTIVDEDGVTTVPPMAPPEPTGGWLALGYDEGPDHDERTR